MPLQCCGRPMAASGVLCNLATAGPDRARSRSQSYRLNQSMPVITIGRQFGAGGTTVGQMLAQQLQADLLDAQLISEVARRLEVPKEELEAQDERPSSLLSRLLMALGSANAERVILHDDRAWTPTYKHLVFDARPAVLEITQQVIREAARGGNVIIIGRGGAHILRDLPGAVHVFLRAAEGTRAKILMQRDQLTEDEATRLMRQTDAHRSAYIRQVYGHNWAHATHYDLVLDTGRLGYRATVAAILAASPGRVSNPNSP